MLKFILSGLHFPFQTSSDYNNSQSLQLPKMGSEPISEKKVREPFSRAMKDEPISNEQRLKELWHILDLLEIEYKKTSDLHTLISSVSESLTLVWKRRDPKSELALKGLLLILEYCLSHVFDGHSVFEVFVTSLGFIDIVKINIKGHWNKKTPKL